ncbi:MAG: hypothetical protein US81_C0043G0001, partial [Parcubacteria group bacterium GW2011_GWE2_38_18]
SGLSEERSKGFAGHKSGRQRDNSA